MSHSKSVLTEAKELVACACCELAKEDIPEVEAVIALLTPLMEAYWTATAEELEDLVLDQLLMLADDQPTDPVDGASNPEGNAVIEDLIFAILGSLMIAVGRPVARATRINALASAELLIRQGAASRALPIDLTTPRASTMVEDAFLDLELHIRGRVLSRRRELERHVGSFLRTRELRTEPGRSLWTQGLRKILDPGAGFVPVTVDAWAYRWHNIGSFEAMVQNGVTTIVAFNNPPVGPDGKTTPFCRWVHGQELAIDITQDKIAQFRAAVRAGEIQGAVEAWPLLNFKGDESESEFRVMMNRVGLPPYHGKCRTQALPG